MIHSIPTDLTLTLVQICTSLRNSRYLPIQFSYKFVGNTGRLTERHFHWNHHPWIQFHHITFVFRDQWVYRRLIWVSEIFNGQYHHLGFCQDGIWWQVSYTVFSIYDIIDYNFISGWTWAFLKIKKIVKCEFLLFLFLELLDLFVGLLGAFFGHLTFNFYDNLNYYSLIYIKINW